MPPPERPTGSDRDLVVTDTSPRGTAAEDQHTEAALLPAESSERTKLVCLLPARNTAVDLPGFFESAERFCDAIVALDDGSTDNTRELLEAHPLVKILLANPRRESYAGWNDARNRNQLLEAAAELNPEWIISIDADERLDPSDAAALREFLDQDALPGCAYGFRVFPMQYDLQHYVPESLWVYRLFAYEPGQELPEEARLHFTPVPTDIPRVLYIKTTLRIQHLGHMTEERRRASREKYRQADPEREYRSEYVKLPPDPLSELRLWEPRPADLHALFDADAVDEEDILEVIEEPADAPAMSVVVVARDDERRIARVVASVVNQECSEPFEVVVVASGADGTPEVVREKFPEVTLIELPRPTLPGEARNVGLRLIRGTYVSFHSPRVEMPLDDLASRLRAHRMGYTMVSGVTLNRTRAWTGWAAYFLDHAADLPGQPPSVLDSPPVRCSYARGPLLELGGFPEELHGGEEATVNTELFNRGYLAYRDSQVRSTYHNPCLTPRELVRQYFARGRTLGRIVLDDNASSRGLLLDPRFLEARVLAYVPQRLNKISRDVRRWGEPKHRLLYFWALPLIAAGLAAVWLGMWHEILQPARGKSPILLGRPGRDLYVKLRIGWHDLAANLERVKRAFFCGESSDEDLLVLVDRDHGLPEDYVPGDLVSLRSYRVPTMGEDLLLRQEAAKHLSRLMRTANAAGERFVVASAYRSFQYQRTIFEEVAEAYGHNAAVGMSALPGHSQHQLGTTVDFTNEAVGYRLEGSFGDTSAGRWLLQNASEYGFVLAYPRGGETETGYQWEPWHYRYIGMENVQRLRASGLSLQAFLLREGVLPRPDPVADQRT